MDIPIARTFKEDKKVCQQGNFLRQIEFYTTKEISESLEKLHYPTTLWKIGEDFCEVYDIPIQDKEQVLNEVNVLVEDHPIDVTKKMMSFDGEEEFMAQDLKIIWFNGCNYIVSPYFDNTGTTFESCIEVD